MISKLPKLLLLALAACGLAGCASRPLPGLDARRWQCSRDDRLVGTWTTAIVMSQLGPGFEKVTYDCDCTFKATSGILMLIIPLGGSQSGWYSSSGDALVTESGVMRTEAKYHFEGKVLVVQEGTQTIRFHSLRHRSCARKTEPPPGSPNGSPS